MRVKNEEISEEFIEIESPEKKLGEGGGFSELIKYTVPGYILGLLAGVFLDIQGVPAERYRAVACQDSCRRGGEYF